LSPRVAGRRFFGAEQGALLDVCASLMSVICAAWPLKYPEGFHHARDVLPGLVFCLSVASASYRSTSRRSEELTGISVYLAECFGVRHVVT
jgi:hypothetical protein